jgi:TP901 family phage tail tape measure protein
MAGSTAAAGATGKVAKASTKAAQAVTHMSTSLNTLSFRAQTTGRLLFRNIGLPLLAIGGFALKTFVSFEKSMVKIEALVGISSGAVAQFTERVKEVSEVTGRGPQELADAMFFVSSAGLRGATAMEVMEASAKGAAIGLGETSVVADAATSAVNAYGSENLSGAAAVDILTAAVREGKVEATRLTPAIGKAIPVASAMGIEFHEVAAAIAAMTRTGTDARTSAIQLRQIMQSILDPSRQTTKALKEMGVAEGELADMARNKGLLAVLVKLRDLSKDNAEAFADVFPNVRALAGAMDITGENLDENTQIFAQLANSVGDTDDAFQKIQKTGAHKLAVAMAKLKVGFTNFGESLAPLVGVMAGLLESMGKFFNFLSKHGVLIGIIAGIGMLTTVSGLLLIMVGRLTQAYVFLQASLVKYSASAAMATRATQGLMLVSGAGVFMAVAAVVGVLTTMTLGLGRKSETSAKKLANLKEALGDVRTAGEEVIKPIEGMTAALRELNDVTDEGKLASRFEEAFAEGIEDAFDEGTGAGGLQAEEAIARFFFGRGDTPAVRKALLAIMDDINRTIGGGSDVFLRLFGPTTSDRGEAITNFLLGDETGLRQGIKLRAQLAADAIDHEFVKVIDKSFDQLSNNLAHKEGAGGLGTALWELFAEGEIDETAFLDWLTTQEGDITDIMNGYTFDDSTTLEDWVERAVGNTQNLLDGLKPFAIEIDSFMRQHQFRDFGTMWNDFLESVTAGETDPGKIAREIEVYSAAFMNLLDDISLFEDEITDAKNMDEFMQNIVSAMDIEEGEEGRDMFSGRKMMEAFATDYVNALVLVENEIEQYGLTVTEAERRTMVMERAMNSIENEIESMGGGFSTLVENVKGVFEEFDVAFSSADENAKRLAKRYDNLIGRTMSVTESQDDFNSSLFDMIEALEEGGGSLDAYTAAGRDNRSAIREQIDSAVDYGKAIFEAGGSAEEAEAAVLSALGTIHSNALKAKVNPAELDKFYRDMGVTPERIEMMFLDDNEEIGAALQETMRQVAQGERGFIGPLFSGLGREVPAGMIQGIRVGTVDVLDAVEAMIQSMVDTAISTAEIGSPSKLFKVEVGEPIIDGIYEGIWEGVPRITNALRLLIDSSISTVRSRMGTVTGALTSMLNLEQAEADLDRIRTKHGGEGVDTDFERWTEQRLKADVDEAKRALRLGQGNMYDLKLALQEAEFALEDFDSAAQNESTLEKAEIKVADAGLRVVEAQVQLQMQGEAAATAFNDIATAAGLTEESIDRLLGQTGDGNSILEKFADPATLEIIRQVAAGIGVIVDSDEAEDAEQKRREEYYDQLYGPEILAGGHLGTSSRYDAQLRVNFDPTAQADYVRTGGIPGLPGLGEMPSGDSYSDGSAQNMVIANVHVYPTGTIGIEHWEALTTESISAAVRVGADAGLIGSWTSQYGGSTTDGPKYGQNTADGNVGR